MDNQSSIRERIHSYQRFIWHYERKNPYDDFEWDEIKINVKSDENRKAFIKGLKTNKLKQANYTFLKMFDSKKHENFYKAKAFLEHHNIDYEESHRSTDYL